jgi:hypothetical protein
MSFTAPSLLAQPCWPDPVPTAQHCYGNTPNNSHQITSRVWGSCGPPRGPVCPLRRTPAAVRKRTAYPQLTASGGPPGQARARLGFDAPSTTTAAHGAAVIFRIAERRWLHQRRTWDTHTTTAARHASRVPRSQSVVEEGVATPYAPSNADLEGRVHSIEVQGVDLRTQAGHREAQLFVTRRLSCAPALAAARGARRFRVMHVANYGADASPGVGRATYSPGQLDAGPVIVPSRPRDDGNAASRHTDHPVPLDYCKGVV